MGEMYLRKSKTGASRREANGGFLFTKSAPLDSGLGGAGAE